MIDGRQFYGIQLLFRDFTEAQWIFELQKVKNSLKIHWDAVMGFRGKHWRDFVKAKDTEAGTFFVHLQFADYYNFQFSDPEEYQCFSVMSFDREDRLFGYVKRGTQLDKALRVEFAQKRETGGDAIPAVVKVRFPEKANGDQLIIEDFTIGWIPVADSAKKLAVPVGEAAELRAQD
jgi:hypothetical protein